MRTTTLVVADRKAETTQTGAKHPKEATVEFWTYRFEGEEAVADRLWRYTLRRIRGDWYAAYLHDEEAGGPASEPDCMVRARGHRVLFTDEASFVRLGGFPTLRNGEWASGFPTDEAVCWAQVLRPLSDCFTAAEAAAEISWELEKPVSPARVRRVARAHKLFWVLAAGTGRVRGENLPILAELLR